MTCLAFALLVFVGIQNAAAVTHSLQYFYTASSGIKDFPEFVNVGLLDGLPISYYDSVIRRKIPKQDWMAKNEGPEYWESSTQINIGTEQSFKSNIQVAKQRFNHTGGVHIFQWMYGCEWDDETGEVKGYRQYGYDGEDFISQDQTTESWIAAKPQAVLTKNKWDSNKVELSRWKNYITQECPDWVKKYVNYGRSSLMRTVLPSVSLLQKSSSSPVRCHAAGFYPEKAEMIWRKDGEEVHDGVEKGEILPNNDGTFQMSVDLSSVPPEDWMKYECVFQLSGEKDLVTKLEKPRIRTNGGSSNMLILPIIIAVVVLAVVAVIGLILYKKKNAKRPPSPVDTSEVQEQMLPTA